MAYNLKENCPLETLRKITHLVEAKSEGQPWWLGLEEGDRYTQAV